MVAMVAATMWAWARGSMRTEDTSGRPRSSSAAASSADRVGPRAGCLTQRPHGVFDRGSPSPRRQPEFPAPSPVATRPRDERIRPYISSVGTPGNLTLPRPAHRRTIKPTPAARRPNNRPPYAPGYGQMWQSGTRSARIPILTAASTMRGHILGSASAKSWTSPRALRTTSIRDSVFHNAKAGPFECAAS